MGGRLFRIALAFRQSFSWKVRQQEVKGIIILSEEEIFFSRPC
jgi:hypothetical protein